MNIIGWIVVGFFVCCVVTVICCYYSIRNFYIRKDEKLRKLYEEAIAEVVSWQCVAKRQDRKIKELEERLKFWKEK